MKCQNRQVIRAIEWIFKNKFMMSIILHYIKIMVRLLNLYEKINLPLISPHITRSNGFCIHSAVKEKKKVIRKHILVIPWDQSLRFKAQAKSNLNPSTDFSFFVYFIINFCLLLKKMKINSFY